MSNSSSSLLIGSEPLRNYLHLQGADVESKERETQENVFHSEDISGGFFDALLRFSDPYKLGRALTAMNKVKWMLSQTKLKRTD